MKQIILVLSFCIAFTIQAFAQNTESGNNPKTQKKEIRKRERKEIAPPFGADMFGPAFLFKKQWTKSLKFLIICLMESRHLDEH